MLVKVNNSKILMKILRILASQENPVAFDSDLSIANIQ